MPVYTYRCEDCGIQFDKRQSFSDEPLKVCPECEQETLHKVYQPVGIVFKGKGFYSTDHRSSSGAKTVSDKTSDKTSETKPKAENTTKASTTPSKEAKSHAPGASSKK